MNRKTLRIASCLAILTVTHSIQADIIREGYKSISNEQTLSFVASVRDRLETSYAIRAGDTLASIAKEELGDEKRFEEILPLNPGIEPTRLEIGQRIILPPKVVAPQERYPYVFLAWAGARPGPSPRILRPGDPIPTGRYGIEILALTPEQLAKVRSEEDPTRFDEVKIRDLRPRITAGHLTAPRTVPRSDPSKHVLCEFTIHGVKEGKVLLVEKRTFMRFSKRIVRIVVNVNDPSLEDAKKEEKDNSLLPVIPLLFAGGLGLIWLATRRRRSSAPEPAALSA